MCAERGKVTRPVLSTNFSHSSCLYARLSVSPTHAIPHAQTDARDDDENERDADADDVRLDTVFHYRLVG